MNSKEEANIRLLMNNKKILTILIITGALSVVFFLPLRLAEKYTCLYHQLVDYDKALPPAEDMAKETAPSIGGIQENKEQQAWQGRIMLDIYLKRYAFIWWASLALTAFCIFCLRRISAQADIKQTRKYNGGLV